MRRSDSCGEGGIDRLTRIASIRSKGRDRRRAHATRVARNREQITDSVVLVCGDIALPVDHLGQPAEVVVGVLGLVGHSRRRGRHTEQQHAGHNRQDFRECHLLHPQSFIPCEKSLVLTIPTFTPGHLSENLPVPFSLPEQPAYPLFFHTTATVGPQSQWPR